MRFWSATNPHVLQSTPFHPQKVTMWCGFHAGGVIAPYFFVDENDRHVTVNRNRYRAMLKDYFRSELMDLTSVICGSNKMVQHATQLVKQLIY